MAFYRPFVIGLTGLVLISLFACSPAPIPPNPTSSQNSSPTPPGNQTTFPSPSPQPPATPGSSMIAGVNTANLKGLHLQFWDPFFGATNDEYQTLVYEFNAENIWGIQVDIRSLGTSSELDRQVQAGLSARQGSGSVESQLPDVLIAYPEQALKWQAIYKAVTNLNGYLSDPSFGLTSLEIADFFPSYWNQGQFDHSQLGIPADGAMQFLFYNLTWAMELGFTQPPSTPEDFRQQSCRAAQANRQDNTVENDGTGGWLVSSDPLTMLSWINAFGGKINSGAGDQYTFNSPQITAAFTYLKNLVKTGCAWLGLNPVPYAYFDSRRALFYSGSLEDIDLQQTASVTANSKDSWTIIPFPSISGNPVVMTSGVNYYILTSSDIRQLAAWTFVRWMASPEHLAQMVRTNGTFPIRSSEVNLLNDYRKLSLQWATALQFIPYANTPPVLVSWGSVEGMLEDASQQLFQPETTNDQITAILSEMDSMAVELSREAP